MTSLFRCGPEKTFAELPTVGVRRRPGAMVCRLSAVVAAVLATVDPQRVAQDSASAVVACRCHHSGHAFDAVGAGGASVPVDGERLVAICSAGNAHRHQKSRSCKGFRVLLIADPGHTLGGPRRNLLWQKSFLHSDQVLWPVGAASRWCPDRFGGMVGYSVQMARLLRPKRQQPRATCAVCDRGPDQGTAVWMP
ncbi:Uncharacterised protein [Mycobacteroides abscessus subsp. abscessus]|nr:Uncharacterised protein [Mycobacteroides abscessus subsp. abscessus]